MIRSLFFTCLVGIHSLFAIDVALPETLHGMQPPWFTGTLLSFGSVVAGFGSIDVEPYLNVFTFTGEYNREWHKQSGPTFWQVAQEPLFQVGIAPRLDIIVLPAWIWNYSQGSAHWEFGDLPLYVGLQLYYADWGNWIPNVKLQLTEIFPTGKYRNFDPHAHGTQASGNGSFETDLGIVLGNIHHLGSNHCLQYRILLNYILPAPAHLTGFNTFGGSYGTDVRFFRGSGFLGMSSLEVTLSQNFAFALDFVGEWYGSDHYSGFTGMLQDGTRAPLGSGSKVRFSMAPAIEYNWSNELGIIGGSWFTFAGRNVDQFASCIIALNYYFTP